MTRRWTCPCEVVTVRILRVLLAVSLMWPASLWAASREDWARLMLRKGVRPGPSMSLEEWNGFLDKLLAHAQAQNVEPARDMPDATWEDLVRSAGLAGPVASAPTAQVPPMDPSSPAPSPAAAAPVPSIVIQEAPLLAQTKDGRPPVAQKVSLDLKSMDIVEVLKILSRQSGLNFVVGQQVRGRVTVFLKDVPFWSAMDNIMFSQNLAYAVEGDLVNVLTEGEYLTAYGRPFGEKREILALPLEHLKAQSAKEFLEPFKSRVGALYVNEAANVLVIEDTPAQILRLRDLAKGFDVPLETRIFKLNYSLVDDILAKVSPLVSKSFGQLQADKRSNTLVYRDNPARIREMEDVIKAFDAPHKTVLIDAKIIQVNLSDDFQWGINWERAFHYNRDSDSSYKGVAVGNTQVLPLASVNPVLGPITAPGFTARITSLGPMQVSAALNFLETVGKTNLLSSPRITALNNEQAKIVVASQIPKITKTISNIGSVNQPQVTTDNVTFENVGLELFVTPSIGGDGFITMKIKPKVTALESTITTEEGSVIPVIRTSEAETTVLAKDGVTILIAGLIEDKKTDEKAGVPLLARIPLIGWLFGSKKQEVQKTELVIFLTPRIVTGEETSAEARVYLDKAPQWKSDRTPEGAEKK